LDVTGNLNLNGVGRQFIMRGYASVSKLNVFNGQLTIQNSVDIANINIAKPGSVVIIGGPENQRNFGNVSGDGLLIVQGGTNTLKGSNLANFQLLSGKITSDNPLIFGSMLLVGGELAGKAQVTATSVSFSSATVTTCAITTANLDVGGFSTLQAAAKLTLVTAGKVSAPAQFTLNGGSIFSLGAGSQFTQNFPFSLVPGADAPAPTFNNDGTWTSASTATVVVNVQGKGNWVTSASGVLAVTGVTFTIGSGSIAGAWKFLGVIGTLPTLSGTGYVELNGRSFTINSVSIGSLSHFNGDTTINSGSVTNLTVTNGNFIVGTQLNVNLFNFTSGVLSGRTGSVLSAANTVLATASPKNIQKIRLSSTAFTWDCSGLTCPMVATDAQFGTPKKAEEL